MGITHKDIPAFIKSVGTRDQYFIVWYEAAKTIETATCETIDEVTHFLATLEDIVGPVSRVAIQRIEREQVFKGTLADFSPALI